MYKLVKALGILLLGASLLFVFERIWTNSIWTIDQALLLPLLEAIALGVILYTIGCFLLSTAWWVLISHISDIPISFSAATAIYGRTQLVKYLPGNVFHYLGRHALGRHAGLDHRSLVLAAVLETVAAVAAAICISILGWGVWTSTANEIELPSLIIVALAVLAAVVILNAVVRRIPRISNIAISRVEQRMALPGIIRATLLYTVFFAASSFILWLLLRPLDYEMYSQVFTQSLYLLLLPLAAVSWLAGFVTPGAPAGIGIRESVLILALAPYIDAKSATLVAMAFRLVTISGDSGFFLVSHLFNTRSRNNRAVDVADN
jgi:hypothetical protein